MTPRVLVTRPESQAAELCRLLRDRRLDAVAVPTVAIDRASSAEDLDAMLPALAGADWLVLTSANGAEALAERLARTGARLPEGLRLAAVGPATADALRAAGIAVDHVPAEYRTVAIADGLGALEERRVVLARADGASPELSTALLARGARVEEVVAYRTVEGPADSREALLAALNRGVDAICFTSGSTVRGLLRLLGPLHRPRARVVPAFCIGPVTADQARRSGFDVAAVAHDHTGAGLADAVATHFAREDS